MMDDCCHEQTAVVLILHCVVVEASDSIQQFIQHLHLEWFCWLSAKRLSWNYTSKYTSALSDEKFPRIIPKFTKFSWCGDFGSFKRTNCCSVFNFKKTNASLDSQSRSSGVLSCSTALSVRR
jgi:hypothetical protein